MRKKRKIVLLYLTAKEKSITIKFNFISENAKILEVEISFRCLRVKQFSTVSQLSAVLALTNLTKMRKWLARRGLSPQV